MLRPDGVGSEQRYCAGGARGRLTVTLLATLLLTVGFASAGLATQFQGESSLSRDDQPLVLSGSSLPALTGIPVADIALFRYDDVAGAYVPIPFQVDERLAKVFSPGELAEFTQVIHDVLGEDDGLFDDLDEIAVLYGDAGPQAPVTVAWPDGSDATRVEVAIDDPRPGVGAPQRFVYVHTGSALARSATSYVSWNGLADATIASDEIALDYDGVWLLTGYRLSAPCGDGYDLIDRFKGRATTPTGLQEDEEDWNLNALYLGGIVGPVRAIRYVRGARSAVNLIHYDIVYRKVWQRQVQLRVHPLERASLYFDWLPQPGATVYSPSHPSGLVVDGVPDSGVTGAFQSWQMFSGPDGGLVVLYDIPDSPLYDTKSFMYRDDADYDDMIPLKSVYPDDDDSAYGNHGFELETITGSNIDPILIDLLVFPLCGNEGGSGNGAAYQELADFPFSVSAVQQNADGGPVRTLEVEQQGQDLLLSWDPVPRAIAYRIYRAESPAEPHATWTLLAEVPQLQYVDPDAASQPEFQFYSVVPKTPIGEGEW